MIESTKIYSRDASGKQRYWFYEVDGEQWRGHSGLCAEGSADVTSGWTKSKPKNVGKKNERSAGDQAAFEAEAEFRKKLDREYRRTPEELGDVMPSPMLAQKFKDVKKGLRYHPGGYIQSQPKLDGIRCFLSDRWGASSRDYQPFGPSVNHIRAALTPVFADAVGKSILFDGELYNHSFKDNFNTISSLVRTEKLSIDQLNDCRRFLQYHVYDCYLIEEPNAPFLVRQKTLREIAAHYDLDLSPVVLVDTVTCDTREELDAEFARYLSLGYEGQMVRQNEPYECDTRSWNLLKRKDFIDVEVEITKLIPGNGNWDGIPKAVEYIFEDDKRGEDGQRPKAGIKGDMEFCRQLASRPVTHATIRYFCLTPAGVPRLPVAVDFTEGERRD